MAGFAVTGVITKIGETKEVGSNGFNKRAVLIQEQDGKYTNNIFAEFVQDKCSLLDNFTEGEEVTLDINVRCNEHGGRYFTNLTAWRITSSSEKTKATQEEQPVGQGVEPDDMPF